MENNDNDGSSGSFDPYKTRKENFDMMDFNPELPFLKIIKQNINDKIDLRKYVNENRELVLGEKVIMCSFCIEKAQKSDFYLTDDEINEMINCTFKPVTKERWKQTLLTLYKINNFLDVSYLKEDL